MFKTIAQQTLQNRNNNDFVESNGPFPVHDVKESFLGNGYYFWDNHIELAHFWGQVHCSKKYIICECEIEVIKNDFFDLVGSREDQINFSNIVDKLQLHDMAIGEIIEVLKDLETKSSGIFPYKAIRAADYSIKKKFPQVQLLFQKSKTGFTILSPMYIICLLKKNELILPPYKVIFS